MKKVKKKGEASSLKTSASIHRSGSHIKNHNHKCITDSSKIQALYL